MKKEIDLKNDPLFPLCLKLSLPTAISQAVQVLYSIVDRMYIGHIEIIGSEALAAVGIASPLTSLVSSFSVLIGLGGSPIMAMKLGSGDKKGASDVLNTALYLLILLSLILFPIFYFFRVPLLSAFGATEANIAYAEEYLRYYLYGTPFVIIANGLASYLINQGESRKAMVAVLSATLANIVLDPIFIFTFSLGVKGAAIATLIVRSLMGLVMLLYVLKYINFKVKSDFALMGQFVRVGTPIGMALLIEFLAFNIITILVGKESGLFAATHNILITISSVTFNVPLAISVAVAVKVAYNYGAKKYDEIRKYAYMGIFMGVAFMALCSVILALFPRQLVGIFTKDTSVLNIAMPIVIIAAMYQVFDGFQVVMGGVLKGFKMTKAASLCVFWGYWIVGMPVAYILVNKYGMSLKGYWIALAVSLCFIGIFAAFIAKQKFKKIKNL